MLRPRPRRALPALLLALAAAATAVAAPPQTPASLSRPLAAALAAPDDPVRRADGRLVVWVRFRDKGVAAADLPAALDAAAAALDPRARARRARTRPPGAPLVDAADLPVAPAHLAAVRATGAEVRHTSRWLNAASCVATDAQVARLAALPQVARLDLVARERRTPGPAPTPLTPDRPPHAPQKAAAAWTWEYGANLAAMEQVNVPAVHALGLRGRDVVVGVLDTGFRTTHVALRHLPVLDAWDFVDGDPVVDEQPGDPAGSRNHGTMVLSNLGAYRVGQMIAPAPGVALLLARTEHLTDEFPAEEDNWVAGLEWAEAAGADLISSSLGYIDWYEPWDLDGNTAVTTRAADMAAARGLLVVTAAGNSRNTTGTLIVPGDADSVVTVGAVDSAGNVASFSSPGPTADNRIKPDVAARGVSNTVVNPNDDLAYGASSGTSFSTPLVAGVAALVLERAPDLTPVQVREALRGGASQAGAPDNDVGWGVVDALAAVTWFGPVFTHRPLPDSEDTGGPYTAACTVSARAGLAIQPPELVWRADGGPWQAVPLAADGGNPPTWTADIPGQPTGTEVEYYLVGADAVGVTVSEPVRAPDRRLAFHVGPDTTPPQLEHWPVGNQTPYVWPPTVRCTATDNLGVAGVDLRFRVDGGPEQGPYPLTQVGWDDWELAFPLAAGEVSPGQTFSYTLTATDAAAAANTAVDGPRGFELLAVPQSDTTLTDTPALAVPDDDPGGAVATLTLDAAAGGALADLRVGIDLVHPDVSQLRLVLVSPQGTAVTLHDRSGAGADLLGTWPTTLDVDGPGDLADCLGEEAAGTWTLQVFDEVPGGTGALVSWNLQLTTWDAVSRTGDGVPGALDTLAPVAPNPFNPRTRIAFTLARGGRTRLSVFDLRGMLVRDLLDRTLTAGPHTAGWDGRDGRGRDAASGVYLLRLTTPDRAVLERKMTLLR